MSLFKIRPARTEKEFPKSPIADLDEMSSLTITFRFNGVIYELLPVTMERFLELHRKQEKIREILSHPETDSAIIYQSYLDLFHIFCPKIQMKQLKSMSLVQLHALLHLMVEHVTGQTQEKALAVEAAEKEEKKNRA